ncbi:MAG: metal-dependent transcriptional regulator [Clostridia bacterium]|nr:metal-dependent transcriptional regulator [Clostridia bacterium]
MRIKESGENYLETILILKQQLGYVRSIDVAHHLGVSKPSVSVAMKILREDGYITVDEAGNISLTKNGTQIADRMYERHQVIAKALIALGVSEETAFSDSCKIEHDLSQESFEKIKYFLENSHKKPE